MYFAVDPEHRVIRSEEDTFSAHQFKKVLSFAAQKQIPVDMTAMTQRFVRMDFDWDALEKYYNEHP